MERIEQPITSVKTIIRTHANPYKVASGMVSHIALYVH